jgi:hypothetical protein
MRDKVSWFINIRDTTMPEITGVGECGPLPGLSPDHTPEINEILEDLISRFNSRCLTVPKCTNLNELNEFILDSLGKEIIKNPSIVFAFETALLDLINGGDKVIFNNSFIKGTPI